MLKRTYAKHAEQLWESGMSVLSGSEKAAPRTACILFHGLITVSSLCMTEPQLVYGLYNALVKLEATVLWVLSESDEAALAADGLHMPKHVHILRFAPQNDLLGSPCVKMVVTQGGSNSFYEVLLHASSKPHLYIARWRLHTTCNNMLYSADSALPACA